MHNPVFFSEDENHCNEWMHMCKTKTIAPPYPPLFMFSNILSSNLSDDVLESFTDTVL